MQVCSVVHYRYDIETNKSVVNRGWYSQAYGQCALMYQGLSPIRGDIGSDVDAHPLLARRAFLTLVILERFNAAGTAARSLIPDQLANTSAADESLLGQIGYSALRKRSFS